jgi:hypothetical protein
MLSLTLIFRNFHWRHGERIYRRKSPQLSIEAIARYRDQQFEPGLLQRLVSCEPDFFDRRSPKKKSGYRQKSARTRRAYRLVRSEAQSSITSLCAAKPIDIVQTSRMQVPSSAETARTATATRDRAAPGGSSSSMSARFVPKKPEGFFF